MSNNELPPSAELTGLDLATLYTVVNYHSSFEQLESEGGQSPTFKINRPALPTWPALPMYPNPRARPPYFRDELILVADDEPAVRRITERTLEAFGYKVVTAADGAEAVARYARHGHSIALVLTDMKMPVMDGTATIHMLRRINPAVRIIAVSGLDTPENVARAMQAGAHDFLAKPYSGKALIGLVRAVLNRSPALTIH